ncbi:MAG: O-antigen ligase family protein [Microgenomates group bacterium]
MQVVIQTIIYLLTIFIPLTFTIINSELFEFPKFIILLSGTIAIVLAWAFHIFKTKDINFFKPNLISYSLLTVLATQALATIFSIHPYTSFWGYYSRFHGGLLTTICYTVIYFAALKWMDTKSTQKLIKISIGTAIFVGLYAILERLGIDKSYWIQDVQSRPFSTLGQPNWLAAYMIPNIFLAMYQITSSKKPSFWGYASTGVLIVALVLTRSRSGLIGFLLSLVTYYLLLARQFNFSHIKNSLFIFATIFVVSAITLGNPFTPSLTSKFSAKYPPVVATGTSLENGGTESGDIRKIVWSGALKLIEKYPILGTGPETFAYTYYWARPIAHNMTSEWDFLYNKAHNEYLNIAAGSGLIGLLAYLFFHLAVFIVGFTKVPKTKKVNQDESDALRHLYPVLASTIVGFTITNFFGFSVIPVYFMMIVVATLASTQKQPSIIGEHISSTYYLILPLLLIYPLSLFMADANYAKGKAYLDSGKPAVALPYLQKSAGARPSLDLYHATLGEIYAQLGQTEKALSELDLNKQLNPYHLNFYKSRAKIYLTLATLDPKYHVGAASELKRARELAPTDPKLAYNLGLVYTRLSDLPSAEDQLKQAIALKPNYPEPYYALTLLYEQDKKTDLIPDLLASAKANLATYSAQLKEKIEKYISR